jgi:hypothetical protein
MKLFAVLAAMTFGALVSSPALADPPAPKKTEIHLGDYVLNGRAQVPKASVDVAKLPAKLTISEARQGFADRIDEAVTRAPF